MSVNKNNLHQAHDFLCHHSRIWGQNVYVYPVISRRSSGLSIGINLNLDASCNFHCVYCQVDRTLPRQRQDIDLEQLGNELHDMLLAVQDGSLWASGAFSHVPTPLRRLDNLAIAGDGEPTLCRWFPEAIAVIGGIKTQLGLHDLKLVLMTNASRLGDVSVRQALKLFDALGGEVWAKLDVGSEATFQAVNRARVPFQEILKNVALCGQERPLVIQSMFLHLPGLENSAADFGDFLDRLAELLAAGCRIKALQLYTLARPPAESGATPLADAELDTLAHRVRTRFPSLPVEAFYTA